MTPNDMAILRSGDLRRPWQSPLGFPTLVGRLAAGESLLLICREDEVDSLMTKLNSMLASTYCLTQAHTLLSGLEQETYDSLVRRMGQQANPLTEDDVPAVLDEIEAFLSTDTHQSVRAWLACLLSPDRTSQAIAGREAMLFRLRRLNRALAEVKDCGFIASIQDPADSVTSRSNSGRLNIAGETGGSDSTVSIAVSAPVHNHLTLRRYLITRSD